MNKLVLIFVCVAVGGFIISMINQGSVLAGSIMWIGIGGLILAAVKQRFKKKEPQFKES